MDQEQTKNSAAADQPGAGDNVEVQETIPNRPGKDADGGCKYKRLGFCSNQDVSGGRERFQFAVEDYTVFNRGLHDYLTIVAKAARIAGS